MRFTDARTFILHPLVCSFLFYRLKNRNFSGTRKTGQPFLSKMTKERRRSKLSLNTLFYFFFADFFFDERWKIDVSKDSSYKISLIYICVLAFSRVFLKIFFFFLRCSNWTITTKVYLSNISSFMRFLKIFNFLQKSQL